MKNHGWVNASNMWRQNLRIANETRYSQITERMDPKHLASVPILGICDEYSSFGVRQLARDQSGDRCGDAFQTIWCSSPAVARTRAGGFLRVLDAVRSDRTADRAMVCGCDP